jgi:hypothetical protein
MGTRAAVAGQETLDQRDHRKTNMKRLIATAISLAPLAAAPAAAQSIAIVPDGSRPSGKGVAPHWHGAAAANGMIFREWFGRNVDRLGPVSDEQYLK